MGVTSHNPLLIRIIKSFVYMFEALEKNARQERDGIKNKRRADARELHLIACFYYEMAETARRRLEKMEHSKGDMK